MFGVWSDSQRILKYFELKFEFQNGPNVSVKVLGFDDFNSIFLSNFKLYLNFVRKETCIQNKGLQVWYLESGPVCNRF